MANPTSLASCATAGLVLFAAEPAFPEFQIQEAGIEKGEVELEYRGAYHWGVPQVTDTNENASDLVQSHELELQIGVTDWWLLSVTAGLDQPLGENLQGSAVEVETEFALLKRQGDGMLSPSKLATSRRSITALKLTVTPISLGSAPSSSWPKDRCC
jgi:hypothetical protein